MAETAIILFAHGARDPEWAQPFRKIKLALDAKRPGIAVELAFLEIMEPALADAVAKLALAGHKSITIAPLFMAQRTPEARSAEHSGRDSRPPP